MFYFFHLEDDLNRLPKLIHLFIWLAADQYEPKTTAADQQDALYRHRVAEKGRVELDAAAITLMRSRWNIWGGAKEAIPHGGARQV